MTVSQIAKTPTSVTISIAEMSNEYDRNTTIMVPGGVHSSGKSTFCSLESAIDNHGYLGDYQVSNVDENNGWIKIEIAEQWAEKYPVIRVRVQALKQGTETVVYEVTLNTVLGFQYDGDNPKLSGVETDITVRDLTLINRFSIYMSSWINGTSATFDLLGAVSGSPIYADFLRIPADIIYRVAFEAEEGIAELSNILVNTIYISNNCHSGAPFEAEMFNNMADAINNFMMSSTM